MSEWDGWFTGSGKPASLTPSLISTDEGLEPEAVDAEVGAACGPITVELCMEITDGGVNKLLRIGDGSR